MTQTILANDLVINEDECNLSCSYCLTGQSNMKGRHLEQRIFGPPRIDQISEGSELRNAIDCVENRVSDWSNCPILKVTGGEIFLIRGMLEYLSEIRKRYEILIVQTNGVLITEAVLREFEEWGNVVIQLSLDSHDYEGNRLRVHSLRLHDRFMRNIRVILESCLPIELYTVITRQNAADLLPFVEWIAQNDYDAQLVPFPVRGPSAENWQIRPDQIRLIEDFAAHHNSYSRWLPAKPYMDRLLRFYRDGERQFRCHVPRIVLSTFSDGVVNACPNIWFSSAGNLLSENWRDVLEKVSKSGLYKALLADRPRLAACKGCFTPWDLLSMYFDDEITLEELCRTPSYNGPRARKILMDTKDRYKSESSIVASAAAPPDEASEHPGNLEASSPKSS